VTALRRRSSTPIESRSDGRSTRRPSATSRSPKKCRSGLGAVRLQEPDKKAMGRIPPAANNPMGKRWIGFAAAHGWGIGFPWHATAGSPRAGRSATAASACTNDDIVKMLTKCRSGRRSSSKTSGPVQANPAGGPGTSGCRSSFSALANGRRRVARRPSGSAAASASLQDPGDTRRRTPARCSRPSGPGRECPARSDALHAPRRPTSLLQPHSPPRTQSVGAPSSTVSARASPGSASPEQIRTPEASRFHHRTPTGALLPCSPAAVRVDRGLVADARDRRLGSPRARRWTTLPLHWPPASGRRQGSSAPIGTRR
jgi:hypothetical protein